MRIFLDTNVLVSAFASKGICHDIFEFVSQKHELILGDDILEEFDRILITKFNYHSSSVQEIIFFLRTEFGSRQAGNKISNYNLGDKSDENILSTAIEAHAELLISGDKHFLNNRDEVDRLEILSPREFWEKYHES